MARKGTAGTRQLVVDMDSALRDRLDARVGAEERTLRKVVERAVAYYLDNVPVNGTPAADPPKRTAKRKLKGEQPVPPGKGK
jgi:hypothetical protein